jgi:ligand-binding SRPBCC domain-containing protein
VEGPNASGLSVCPSAVVEAPVERVWDLVTQPESLHLWTDAALVRAEPDGPAQPGQLLHLVTRAMGWAFAITMRVGEVDAERRRLGLLVELPFGIVNDEMITLADAGGGRTLVRFG